MKRFLKFSTIVLLSCAAINSASAQELDEKGIQLKAMFQDMIERSKGSEVSRLSTLSFDGDLSVEKAGSYYAVTLPYVTLNYNDGAKFEVGLIAINAAPHEKEDEWKMTFALPTPMNFIDETGEKSFQVNIGAQRASGVWNGSLGYFSKLDANFQTISMSDAGQKMEIKIPAVRTVYDLDENDQGKWSGPVYLTMDGMSIDTADMKGFLSLGKTGINMEMFDYDPSALKTYQSKLEKIFASEAEKTPSPSSDDISGLIDSLVAMMGNGMTSEYQIENLVIRGDKIEEGEGEGGYQTVRLDKANMGFDMTGFLDNKVALDLRLGYNGFDISPMPEDMPDLAPRTFNLDFSLQNIPFREIADMGRNSAEMAISNPQMAGMAGMSVLFKLPALLSQAGTSLVIDKNHFGNDTYHVSLDGKVITDIKAANSATADITATLRGLDQVVEILGKQMQETPESENASFVQQLLMGLTMAKGFAKVENNENGEPVHTYKFIMNPQGQMLLNDQDMSALMGGMPPMGMPAPTEQTQQP